MKRKVRDSGASVTPKKPLESLAFTTYFLRSISEEVPDPVSLSLTYPLLPSAFTRLKLSQKAQSLYNGQDWCEKSKRADRRWRGISRKCRADSFCTFFRLQQCKPDVTHLSILSLTGRTGKPHRNLLMDICVIELIQVCIFSNQLLHFLPLTAVQTRCHTFIGEKSSPVR